jgi:predicted phage-related endonuclease
VRIVDRRDGIGASEVPAIAGASPYSSPVDLWLRKTGGPETPDNGAMGIGRLLEGPLLKEGGRRQGVALRRNTTRIPHPRYPEVPLYATPDGFAPARSAIAEVKVVGMNMAIDWAGGPPDYVLLQVHAQLACVPKAERAYVLGLVGGTDLRVTVVERDPHVAEAIEGLVADWWRDHVVTGVPPSPSSEADRWALLRASVLIPGRQERMSVPEENVWAATWADLKARIDLLQSDADVIRRQLAEAAETSDLRGPSWTGRWSERAGTKVFTIRTKKEYLP